MSEEMAEVRIEHDFNPLMRGFFEVANGFAAAVKTVWTGTSNLVGDAYRVNQTLWDGKVEDTNGGHSAEQIYPLQDQGIQPVHLPTANNTSLLRYCKYYNNPEDYLGLFGLGVFSIIGGIFYLPWRLLKDSAISASLQVKSGINDAFLSSESPLDTNDQRSTTAKVGGVFGFVIGLTLQVAIYAVAILGFSRHGYHHLARAIRQSVNFLFGIKNDEEIEGHNDALYDNLRNFTTPYPSDMTLFLCVFNLAKLSTLLIYGLAGVFAGVFGSKQSWNEMDRWIHNSGRALFGKHAFLKYPSTPSAKQDGSEWWQDTLKFVSRFGLLPWLIGGTVVCASLLTKMINLSFRFFIGSDYTWQWLKATMKLTVNFVFGTEFTVSEEKGAIDKHSTTTLRGKVDRMGVLMRLLQIATVGIAIVFSIALGSAQAWRQAYYWIYAASASLLGSEVSPEIMFGLGKVSDLDGWQTFDLGAGQQLRTVARFGLLPWLVCGVVKVVLYLGFAAFGMIAFTLQAIWKLTLGNIIPSASGYDGYFNRIYYRCKTGDSLKGLSKSEQIQQKFYKLLRALPPSGEVPGLMSEDEIPEAPHTLIANAKQIGLGRWVLNGFLYDVRKACSLGANTLTEKMIIEFAKAFQEYVKTQAGQSYQASIASFFQPKQKERIMSKILRLENPAYYKADEQALISVADERNNDPNHQKVKEITTFIETMMLTSQPEKINVPRDEEILLKEFLINS